MGHDPPRESVPTRGFFGTWLFLFQRHLGLLAVFVCCVAIVLHIIITTIPPFTPIQRDESLISLVLRAQELGQNKAPSPVVSLAGFTLSDQNDWLNPQVLGLRDIDRSDASSAASFDVKLWDDKFAYRDDKGRIITTKALPTSVWWQPWVMSPGTGPTSAINQHPYVLSVISKDEGSVVGTDRAGLEVLGPHVELVEAQDGSAFGTRQSRGSRQLGLFIGVQLTDFADVVERHVIEYYGPLEVTKRWDLTSLERDQEGTTLHLRARVIRGSAFIEMEIPAGVFFIADTLVQDLSKGTKNAVVRASSLSSTMTEFASSCSALAKKPMTTDAVELLLSDRSKWVLIFDQKISLTCETSSSRDRISSTTFLEQPMLVRLAIVDMTDHEDFVNDVMPGVKDMIPIAWAKRSSDIRWCGLMQGQMGTMLCIFCRKLLADIWKSGRGSVSRFVSELNQGGGDIHDVLKKRFTQFPLRDQLESLALTMQFNLTAIRWNENEVLQAIDMLDPDIIIFAENFIDDANAFWISDLFRSAFTSTHIAGAGRTVLGIAGTQSGTISAFFDKVLSIGLEPLDNWNATTDGPLRKLSDIGNTLPTNRDSVNPNYRPVNMPTTLPVPRVGNFVEMIRASGGGWPYVTYCRPSDLGSSSQDRETCDGAVHAYFFMGRGAVQWIGMDWAGTVESPTNGWTTLLARTIQAAGCTEGRRLEGGSCRTVGRVLLISDVDATRQGEMVADLSLAIVGLTQVKLPNGNVTERDAVDLGKTLNFLRGTKEEYTGNIDGEVTILVDPATESLRDFVLRHALMVPVAGTVEIEPSKSSAMLNYQVEVKPIKGLRQHSLYPPTGQSTDQLLWDPYRAMFYLTPLQRKLEYDDPLGQFVALGPTSLEDDKTTCLPSVVGALCARGFGPSPRCRVPHIIPEDDLETGSKPYCSFSADGTLDLNSWDIFQIRTDLLNGKSAIFNHLKFGSPIGIMINYPTASWDYFVRTSTGTFVSLQNSIHPQWVEYIKWAVSQDVGGTWRLDGDIWAEDKAADDLGAWVRMISRYAQIALVADAVGLRNERRTTIRWIEKALTKFFNNRFDNRALLYDRIWGGVVPCGCDRDLGKQFCVPPPRMGYLHNDGSDTVSRWMGQSCPALTNAAKEGGAGVFFDHHSLWGYVVFSTAVVTKFNPSFANRRVRLQTPVGVRRPKIHHIVISLIQDYANPLLFGPFQTSPVTTAILHRYYPGARYKDWWRLHSYGSGVGISDGAGPTQYSLSEAAFGYWAASLYAEVVGDRDLCRWAQLLTGMEIMAGNAFWHIKEYTETVPTQLRYLGAIGKVSELALSFQTKYSVSSYEVFHAQVLPLNLLSLDLLEPGWVLWMIQRWKSSCHSDGASCERAGADLGLALLNLMAENWADISGVEPFTEEATMANATRGMQQALASIANVPCFQMGSYDCGLHTLTSSVFWAALVSTWGGTPKALEREDGNGRFQIY